MVAFPALAYSIIFMYDPIDYYIVWMWKPWRKARPSPEQGFTYFYAPSTYLTSSNWVPGGTKRTKTGRITPGRSPPKRHFVANIDHGRSRLYSFFDLTSFGRSQIWLGWECIFGVCLFPTFRKGNNSHAKHIFMISHLSTDLLSGNGSCVYFDTIRRRCL